MLSDTKNIITRPATAQQAQRSKEMKLSRDKSRAKISIEKPPLPPMKPPVPLSPPPVSKLKELPPIVKKPAPPRPLHKPPPPKVKPPIQDAKIPFSQSKKETVKNDKPPALIRDEVKEIQVEKSGKKKLLDLNIREQNIDVKENNMNAKTEEDKSKVNATTVEVTKPENIVLKRSNEEVVNISPEINHEEATAIPVQQKVETRDTNKKRKEAVVAKQEVTLVTSSGREDLGYKYISKLKGNIKIVLKELSNVKRLDTIGNKMSKLDPYITVTLGEGKSAESQKSKQLKAQTSDVNLADEVISFNIVDLESNSTGKDIVLHLKVWNSNFFKNSIIAETGVSLLDHFATKPFSTSLKLQLSIVVGKKKFKQRVVNGFIKVDFVFKPIRFGYLDISCKEASNLKNMDFLGKNDPYCVLKFGKQEQKSPVVKNAGKNADFKGHTFKLYIGKKNFFEKVTFSIFDEDLGKDDLIGAFALNVYDLASKAKNLIELLEEGKPDVFSGSKSLYQGKKLSGQINLLIEYFPAGELKIEIKDGINLESKDKLSRQDPFVQLDIKGSRISHTKKTRTIWKGGKNVKFNETFVFNVIDHTDTHLKVFDEDYLSSNDLIGLCKFSILPVYRYGVLETKVKIKKKDQWGKVTTTGLIELVLFFTGPKGVSFPQVKSDSDTFDETDRKNIYEFAQDFKNKNTEDTKQIIDKENLEIQDKISPEFSEDEIAHAFRALDLDNNNYLGYDELYHSLACLGEYVTPREVEEMIAMLDADGDGQVSFSEFKAMMEHPDPGSEEFAIQQQNKLKNTEAQRESSKSVKNNITRLVRLFCVENSIDILQLKQFTKTLKKQEHLWENAAFKDFCSCFQVEPLGKYEQLYDHYKTFSINSDLRGFLLILASFLELPKSEKVDLCFDLFDSDKNNYFDEKELRMILRVSHFSNDTSSIDKKLRLLLSNQSEEKEVRLSRDKFEAMLIKFPNLLLPNIK